MLLDHSPPILSVPELNGYKMKLGTTSDTTQVDDRLTD